jgi:glyoxylase-like metal-dependent hydrolase (beta-lactamase superfamily II)/rhodanese-related sulfurtransferase
MPGVEDVELDLVVTPGLGDNSFVLSSRGEAILVDPQRDIDRFLRVLEERGARARYVLETHVHNDYVSGAAELVAATGAQVVGPAEARYAFPYTPMAEGDRLTVGAAVLTALETPGHTPEHLAYGLSSGGGSEPAAVFTGGSLIVGSAGRTDLLGPERTETLTHAQFRTLQRLKSFPAGTRVLPTHGAGSFCATVPPQEERTSTIGRELGSNPALAETDEATFVRRQVSGLMAYPAYYAHMAPINRAGPPVVGGVPVPPEVPPEEVARLRSLGAVVVDARDGAGFAAAHVPGSINVPLEDSFASYVGWLVPFDEPLVLIVPEPPGEALAEAAVQLFRIGYGRVLGYLGGGVDAWDASGRGVRSYPTVSVEELLTVARTDPSRILDVRQDPEWDAGHLPASRHVFVGDLLGRIGELEEDGGLVTVCASGYRAAMAASLLDRAGVPVSLVARDGVPAALHGAAQPSP